jgi:glycerol-3-phosphate dehydrogenase (NAD(P)+)
MKTTVMGVGAWGTTLAGILADNGHDVVMWSHDPAIAETINKDHENKALFAGVKLSEKITATTDIEAACKDSALIVLVVASKFYAATVQKARGVFHPGVLIVSATKGLNPEDNKRPSEVLLENLPAELRSRVAVLSGPNIAREISARKPATTVVASPHEQTATAIQKFFNTPYFRVYTNTDMAASEIGGTLKNVIAIAAGIVDGLELGDNAKSALMVRGMVEIVRFGAHFGAKAEAFYGLAGMGDLITTCSSKMSRNHFVGENLAKGKTLSEILSGMTAVAEGVEAAKHVHEIALKENISMPVTAQVYAILFEDKPVKQAISDLMTRDLKAE